MGAGVVTGGGVGALTIRTGAFGLCRASGVPSSIPLDLASNTRRSWEI